MGALVLLVVLGGGVLFVAHGAYRVRHPLDWRERTWWGTHPVARAVIANDYRRWLVRRRGQRRVEEASASAEIVFGILLLVAGLGGVVGWVEGLFGG